MAILPVIPSTVTVHLGAPEDTDAENVTVAFPDYIKNVASSEVYPTWPENSIRANIYAQISFALNRVYTEYYRSRGYSFDITSLTAYDQSFVNGRDVFENISRIVDDTFNDYIRRVGNIEPLFAQYCNGTSVTCDGLSQWGSVSLAEEGLTPYEILQNYYGEDIELVFDTPVQGLRVSVPLNPLVLGNKNDDVLLIQIRLNRISANYPSIPKIYEPTGLFDINTENAVIEFQRIFDLVQDGIVGKATWYRIQYIYAGVKRLSELDSEGLTISEVSKQYPDFLAEGDAGDEVKVIQYLLNYVAQYEPSINSVPIDGYYGPSTTEAVRSFQRNYELTVDGIMGRVTYARLYNVYAGIIASLPASAFVGIARPYPGTILVLGSRGEYVTYLQEYINYLAQTLTNIPTVSVTGIYSGETRDAVRIFQSAYGLEPTGTTNSITWSAIAEIYNDLIAGSFVNEGQYPGFEINED